MLGLTLNLGDEISIGPDIRVVVQSYSGGKVRLAIAAPIELSIKRSTEERLDREKSRRARDTQKRQQRRLRSAARAGSADNITAKGGE